MSIRILDAQTVGRIAAGEVIERPASIVKELIENALDAGATSVTVEIKNGGIDYLRVTDNGSGIPPEETRIAFENHATSKISSGDELNDIATLGFRGEALPSIAAVARVTLTTRTAGSEAGTRLQVNGGTVEDMQQIGCPEGTTIVVKDLFYNLPVRRTFLKKPSVEAGYVTDMVTKLILSHPDVAMRLISNGKTTYHSYGDGNLRHNYMAIYGREAAERAILVDEVEGTFRIKGLIGLGDLARPTRSQEFFFVNGRSVRVPMLNKALEHAAQGRVMIGLYPICALSVTIPPNSVDVNVHPSKLEVRFRDEADIQLKAALTLTRACSGTTILDIQAIDTPPVSIPERPEVKVIDQPANVVSDSASLETHQVPQKTEQQTFLFNKPFTPSVLRESDLRPSQTLVHPVYDKPKNEATAIKPFDEPSLSETEPAQAPADSSVVTPKATPSEQSPVRVSDDELPLRVIGVFARTYILVEVGETLVMIDQHAAHERILYEQYKHKLEQGTAAQQLLMPLILHVSQREMETLNENQSILQEAGYEIESFGRNDIQIRAVPFVLGEAETRLLFAEFIDSLDQLKNAAIEQKRSEIILASCKHAVKGGDDLTTMEIDALIREMLVTKAPPNCPHGRPILKVFSIRDIEKMFKRII
ncbi:MAG: DNA mismatch repair endonuclease MutL [Clostridia bacterium]|nr:DNA mismatch repair endonuclease MutL [Clostridia bacterium]